MKYDAQDFNYAFVPDDDAAGGGVDGAVALAAPAPAEDDPLRRNSRAGDDSSKPYIYSPSKKYGMPGGGKGPPAPSTATVTLEDDDRHHGDDGGGAMVLSFAGACCCCACVALLVAGGVLLAVEAFLRAEGGAGGGSADEGNNNLMLAGTILLVLAAGAFLLGCCSCCFSFVAACAGGGGGDGGLPFGGDAFGHDDGDHRHVKVQIRRLNDRYEKAEAAVESVHLDVIGDMKEVKEAQKKEEKKRKEEEKRKQRELEERVRKDLELGLTTKNMRRNYRPIAFFVQFRGDMMLTGMELLRRQVSIIVNCGRPGVDQAVFVVTSPGGAVSPYGLASSQLARIRKAGIKLIVCVDTVAASGGYMMASVGDVIYAAPFAIIGSIGVVTQVPNFQRFLNKHDVDAFLFTAGKHKRTVDVIGDVTDEGKAKLQEELDEMHRAFKDHVALARPALRDTIEDVTTGEFWLAVEAKRRGLVDDIMTSDEYLESISRENEILEIAEKHRKKGVLSVVHGAARAMRGLAEGMASPSHRAVQP